jgi:two-component system NarL family sensor kinase
MENALWLIITASLVGVIFAGFFIATVMFNQKRFIKVQEEKLRESMHLQEVLRERPRQIIKAQEEERKRVARDLHDGISQMLSSIMYKVHAIRVHVETVEKPLSKEVAELIDVVTNDCERTLDELKRIAHNLRPKMFDELGYDAAVRTLLDDFSLRTHIEVLYSPGTDHDPPSPPISQEISLGLFRILQEGLTNIEKHSKATAVSVTSSVNESRYQLVLSDNGRGIAIDRPTISTNPEPRYHGLGLNSMRERAELLGGRCEVLPNTPTGTKIVVEIPIPASWNVPPGQVCPDLIHSTRDCIFHFMTFLMR